MDYLKNKMQNISLENINSLNIQDFFRKLSVVYNRKISPRCISRDEISKAVAEEEKLQVKIHNLEEELCKTTWERDRALGENRDKINELNEALVSMKRLIHELLESKKQRIRHLESKIRREVKI